MTASTITISAWTDWNLAGHDDMKSDLDKLKSEAADLRGTNKQIALSLIRLESKIDCFADNFFKYWDREVGIVRKRLDGLIAEARADRLEDERRMAACLKALGH